MNTTNEMYQGKVTKLGKFLQRGKVSNVLVLERRHLETLLSPSLPLLFDETDAKNKVLSTTPNLKSTSV
jgi:hypothetical protein